MPGIITSRRITSGGSASAISRPTFPSSASLTSIPAASRFTLQRRRIGASSSITSTRAMTSVLYPPEALVTRLHGFGQRKLEGEARATALCRVDPDPAPHRPDEAAGDEQPEPGTALTSRRAVGAVELREDALPLVLRDPLALVDYTHLDPTGAAMRLDGDGSSVRRELDRVVEQVREDL